MNIGTVTAHNFKNGAKTPRNAATAYKGCHIQLVEKIYHQHYMSLSWRPRQLAFSSLAPSKMPQITFRT
jgi:hypothetical protein